MTHSSKPISFFHRLLATILAFCCACLSLFCLFQAEHLSWPERLGGCFLLSLLAMDLGYSAFHAKPSWLSRIGPLP